MILLDFSQTIISGLMVQLKISNGNLSEDLLRHMVLNSIRSYQKKYAGEYGKMVLCCDAKKPWRRDYFPAYKSNRKKSRDNDDKNWGEIFETLDKIKTEICENMPYHYMQVDHAEADDIIAVLTKHYHGQEPILIISGDKDFQQLQKYPSVKQWSPNLGKFVKPDNPEVFLMEHILRGDKSDGIPNVLSDDDVIETGTRQKPLTKKLVQKYLEEGVKKDDKYYRNYSRNRTLIDLDKIPDDLENEIRDKFDGFIPPTGKIFDYLRVHRLDELLDNISDFTL